MIEPNTRKIDKRLGLLKSIISLTGRQCDYSPPGAQKKLATPQSNLSGAWGPATLPNLQFGELVLNSFYTSQHVVRDFILLGQPERTALAVSVLQTPGAGNILFIPLSFVKLQTVCMCWLT
jgi:hypothetical protein